MEDSQLTGAAQLLLPGGLSASLGGHYLAASLPVLVEVCISALQCLYACACQCSMSSSYIVALRA